MDVPLRVPLAGVVLEELGDDELVGVDPAARAAAVVADPGVAGVLLQVVEHRAGAGHHRVLDGLGVRVPRLGRLDVAAGAGLGRGPLERQPGDGDALRHGERDVDERDRLPGRAARLGAQLRAFRRPGLGVLLQQPGVDLLGGLVAAVPGSERGGVVPAGLVVGRRVARVEQARVDRLHEVGVDLPAQAEGLRAGAPPQTRWLARSDGAGVVALAGGRDLVGEVAGRVAPVHAQHQSPSAASSRKPAARSASSSSTNHAVSTSCACRCGGCLVVAEHERYRRTGSPDRRRDDVRQWTAEPVVRAVPLRRWQRTTGAPSHGPTGRTRPSGRARRRTPPPRRSRRAHRRCRPGSTRGRAQGRAAPRQASLPRHALPGAGQPRTRQPSRARRGRSTSE